MRNNWVLAGFTTLLFYVNQWNATLLIVFMALMAIDILTGAGKAYCNGEFKSSIMRKGIVKKAMQTLLLLALLLGEIVAKEATGIQIPAGSYFIALFCIYELASIKEAAPEQIQKQFEGIIKKLKGMIKND